MSRGSDAACWLTMLRVILQYLRIDSFVALYFKSGDAESGSISKLLRSIPNAKQRIPLDEKD